MKNTFKLTGLFAAALSLFFSANVNAQETASTDGYESGFRLGFGANVGYVFDDPYDFALGADARLQYDITERYSVAVTTGFTNLFVGDDAPDLGFIPAKIGFKAFVWENRFYVLAEAGAAFAVTNDYDETSLILAPGIGYANENFDLSLRYEHYNDFLALNDNGTVDEGVGQLSLRIAYGFKL
ncbi:MAG TPA: hypothetical protein VF676_08375 [Flavobacterium sp.]|jgi:hypothetical protein